ncbi:hypothetical protein ACWGJB_17755 [Streptomyces sp. NPDC054813]
MTDPSEIIEQARRGFAPVAWRIFTKKRGKVSGFLRGTSHDPDPLLVITLDGAVEYVSDRKPLEIVEFHRLAGVELRVHGSSFSDSTIVSLSVWLDLVSLDGEKTKWRSSTFPNDLKTIQGFIEAYGAHRTLRGG